MCHSAWWSPVGFKLRLNLIYDCWEKEAIQTPEEGLSLAGNFLLCLHHSRGFIRGICALTAIFLFLQMPLNCLHKRP